MISRNTRQTVPPTANSARKSGCAPRKASAMSGPTTIEPLIAVRAMPNPSARRRSPVRSATMALLPVRNIDQPKAASTTTTITTWSRLCDSARPMYRTALPQTASTRTPRRPKRSAKAPPRIWNGRPARPAAPSTRPTTVIEMCRPLRRNSVSNGKHMSTPTT
jgi:hypothetical protein